MFVTGENLLKERMNTKSLRVTTHKRCFEDAKEIIASEAKQDDSLLSVWTRGTIMDENTDNSTKMQVVG